jgi:hypothetical protein
MMKSAGLALLAGLTGALGASAQAGAVTLAPHRAVYDLALADDRSSGSGAGAMTGRMVFEFTGAACEGYTVNFRFVVEARGQEGGVTVTDLRTSSFETASGDSYQFLSQTFSNRTLSEEVKGSAIREGDGIVVNLTAPKEESVRLEGDPYFPTQHLAAVIDAAKAGKTLFERSVYDGSDAGDRLYRTTAVIGAARTDPPTGVEAGIGTMARWPVSIAYFDAGGTGDQVPEYAVAFDLWENGVSTDLTMDYGDFALTGRLARYEALPAVTCP